MKPSGKPDVGNLQVRFDEGDGDGSGRAISTLLRSSVVGCYREKILTGRGYWRRRQIWQYSAHERSTTFCGSGRC